jgi:hypothetical protein
VQGPFVGELMTCVMCDRAERHVRNGKSNWRAFDLDGEHSYYACPEHFPPDGATAAQFKAAYAAVLSKIVALYQEERSGRVGRLEGLKVGRLEG